MGMVVFGQGLDLMILEVFSNLTNPMISWYDAVIPWVSMDFH